MSVDLKNLANVQRNPIYVAMNHTIWARVWVSQQCTLTIPKA